MMIKIPNLHSISFLLRIFPYPFYMKYSVGFEPHGAIIIYTQNLRLISLTD